MRDLGYTPVFLHYNSGLHDLEAVVAAADPHQPFALLGISQGAATCIAYAVKHPERVSRLVLYGGYSRGWSRRGDSEVEREYQAIVELARVGWGKDNPAFRQVFTSRFIPGASSRQNGLVQRALPQDYFSGDHGGSLQGARPDRRPRAVREDRHADAGSARP